jgi:hypothetical protein
MQRTEVKHNHFDEGCVAGCSVSPEFGHYREHFAIAEMLAKL